MTKKLSACPKCGGTRGYRFTMTLRTDRISNWEGTDQEETTARIIRESSFGECLDCEEKVRISGNK